MLFPFRPETPLTETLRFATDVLEHKDGSEQRIALRLAPRQEFQFDVMAEDGVERGKLENMLFGFDAAQKFEIPIWTDLTWLTSFAGIAATTLVCDTTASDFRVGGKALLYQDYDNNELVTISAVAAGSLTVSGLTKAWPVGTEVYPVRNAIFTTPIRSRRWPTSLGQYTVQFRVTDNNRTLYAVGAALVGFNTLTFGDDTGKYVLDDPNAVQDAVQETYERGIFALDNNTGMLDAVSYWDRSRRGSVKTFVTSSRARLWQVRVLLHYLNGRQKSFMLPTFANDLVVKADIASGTSTISVANTGLTQYNALARNPRKYVRVYKTDGTFVDAQVTSVLVIDAATEQVTVSSPWVSNIPAENIVRISVLEKVRVDSDDIVLSHADLIGTSSIVMPVKAVLE
jgi:hypothetical protein